MRAYKFYWLLSPFVPTLIYPRALLPKPPALFKPYGINIPAQNTESKNIESSLDSIKNYKAIVIFVGGFCDTIIRAVYREFAHFDEAHVIKIYVSFKCTHLFTSSWLSMLNQTQLPLFIIAHSWGASNVHKALQKNLFAPTLHYLLTLDGVGLIKPKARLLNVQIWENVYIQDKLNNPRRVNLIALLGRAWDKLNVSDYNASLSRPFHHASIHQMIAHSHFYKELAKICKA
ncbi:hypothetical protein LS71_001575 [Helicobacter jaachi]|uniref:Alpha/beta hydrolase n=2 Tax=Helicobacter jaachi TaxID=1677920 RepID=A0A4V6I2Y1_9HELI|nr:hypothetical protein LS71_001575 [Helicobacter jaachi]